MKSLRMFPGLAVSLIAGWFLSSAMIFGAELLPPGFRPLPPGVHALVGARVVVRPGETLESATVIIRDGKFAAVGADAAIPPDARVWELKGHTLYAGFIDAYLVQGDEDAAPVSMGEPEPANLTSPSFRFFGTPTAQTDPGAAGPGYQLSRITPEYQTVRDYSPKEKSLAPLRELGFTVGAVSPGKGILRGRSALVLLIEDEPSRCVLVPDLFQHISFQNQPSDERVFPVSLMGTIAATRQSFLDAQQYGLEQAAFQEAPSVSKRPEYNQSLEALQPAIRGKMKVVLEPGSALMVDRAAKLARELGLASCVVASGQEWRRPELAKATGLSFIVPLDFPELPKLPSEEDWEQVSLDQLRSWDWAPDNPGLLRKQGLEIALTTWGLSEKKKFRDNLRLAMDRGLNETDAVAALTTTPARICGVENQLGTIEPGKLANLVVVEGRNYFEQEARVRAVWIGGKIYRAPGEEPRTSINNREIEQGKPAASAEATKPGEEPEKKAKPPELVALEQREAATNQTRIAAAAETTSEKKEPVPEARKRRVARSPAETRGPLAEPQSVLIMGAASIWTCGPAGRLENGDMLVVDGRIRAVGRDLRSHAAVADSTLKIDARGLHVTPGMIDEHSHAAVLGSVNEGSIPCSAMVRIADVVNSETENIYQQLAGGLTSANLLHGSANPIGGQSCVIKLRFGAPPDELLFEEAPAGIKFALGENPKQANWGDRYTTRFPQSRMGVRTFIANRFTAARHYAKEWAAYRKLVEKDKSTKVLPPRRDLELETIAEIIEGKRWIHCHAYRQDEILMLMRLMEDFGVTIGTFEHVLEGYKVADEIVRHGVGASTFADWWAYKFEVYDAIPYNGSLLHERGALVAFNSDSSEMARRMNTEAAKAVKFGGTPEEEALKFVTLNPAKQLRIDSRVGSLEPGKDADFVLWSKSPLDSTTVCLQTWIDGKQYFERSSATERADKLQVERRDLVTKARQLSRSGGTEAPGKRGNQDMGFFRQWLETEYEGKDRGCSSAEHHH